MKKLLLLNGPNLGKLGKRQPEIYGTMTLKDIEAMVAEEIRQTGWTLVAIQKDSESDLIAALNEHEDAIAAIINPGALMIAGWSFRDALAAFSPPWIEVHISNIWAREQFRHHSILSDLAAGIVCGFGPLGYRLAARAVICEDDKQTKTEES